MPNKTQSVLLAGAAIGVAGAILNLIPTAGGCLACIAYLGAGILAVWHYTDRYNRTLKGGRGAGLGALAGLVAAVIGFILQLLFQAIGLAPGWREAMEQQLDQSGMDPAQMEQIIETFSSPLVMTGVVLAGFVVYAIVGGLGGVIGAAIFKRGTDIFEEGETLE